MRLIGLSLSLAFLICPSMRMDITLQSVIEIGPLPSIQSLLKRILGFGPSSDCIFDTLDKYLPPTESHFELTR